MKLNDLPLPLGRHPAPPPAPAPAGCSTLSAPSAHSVLDTREQPDASGTLHCGSHANALGSRDYTLYVPGSYSGQAMPLLLMLHGCHQDPDDFANETRMNLLAAAHGFLVAYPRQTVRSNGASCWNWYEPREQRRNGQEPSLLAGIVQAIALRWSVAPDRVFAAGLSAGAAMAVILGQTYPQVFAGVAAHSGLPRGAAHDMGSAFAAMQGRSSRTGRPAFARSGKPVRTLVLHGDADRTVQVANGCAITRQALAAFRQAGRPLRAQPLPDAGAAAAAVFTDYHEGSGRVMVRECIVRGGVHAWFGGNAAGRFAEADAPDASAEIVRFFLQTQTQT